jgi:hypothetical protein
MRTHALESVLKELRLESFDYDCFEFSVAGPAELEAFQVGYACDPSGNTLLGTSEGDWRENWIVFARDFSDDPVFVDINFPNMPVFTAMHGAGTWSPWEIAPSVNAFAIVLRAAQVLASHRESPVALESNPVADHERGAFEALVEANGVSPDYWLAMFQDLGADP